MNPSQDNAAPHGWAVGDPTSALHFGETLMKKTFVLLAFVCALSGGLASAQFSGPAAFTVTPWSQLGGVTNNLTITNTANGFTVQGQVIVSVPAGGPLSGILVGWEVDRPVVNGYTANGIWTTTILDGYSLPPGGGGGNTTGYTSTQFTDYLGTTTSLSLIPMTLINGMDNPQWNFLSATSTPFNHVGGVGQNLRQVFWLDGIYNGGPGGNWVIDVPVTSFITVVPEPSTYALLGSAAICLAGWRLRRRK